MTACINLQMIETGKIKIIGNVRTDVDTELTASIKEKGIIQALLVRPNGAKGTFELVAGGRRFASAQSLKLKEVPCLVKNISDEEVITLQMIENLQRKAIGVIAEAEAYKEMLNRMTAEEIASSVGRSVVFVRQRLSLLGLSPKHRKAMEKGEISPGHAIVLLRLGNKEDRDTLFEEILDEKLSIRATENLLEEYTKRLENAKFNKKECLSCPYSGSQQKGLFDEETNLKGECLNPDCFQKKLGAFIEETVKKYKDKGRKTLVAENHGGTPKGTEYLGEDMRKELNVAYQTQCKKCEDLLFVIRPNGEVQEYCTKLSHLTTLIKASRGQAELSEENQVISGKFISKGNGKQKKRVDEVRREFFIEHIEKKLTPDVAERLVLVEILEKNYYGKSISAFLKANNIPTKNKDNSNHGRAETLALFKQIPLKALREELARAVAERIKRQDSATLAETVKQINVGVEKDFQITENYLKRLTKAELLKLAKSKEFGIPLEEGKKTEMIETFLKANLKGKVPKELTALDKKKKKK